MDFRREQDSSPDGTCAADAVRIPPEISAQEIRLLLHDILRSKAFSLSKRCGDFLSYIVEQTLRGMQHELKERTIGVAVFGRPATYDTGEDAIVRIKATETRKRLAAYYAEQSRASPLLLTLPPGGYIPQFTRAPSPHVEPSTIRSESADAHNQSVAPASFDVSTAHPIAQPRVPTHRWRPHWRWIAAAIAAIAAVLAFPTYQWIEAATHPTALSQFWGPILEQPQPIFLVISSVPTYLAYAGAGSSGRKPTSQYVLTTDQFIGRGDMLASERISSLLRVQGHAPTLKATDSIDMQEMSNHSVVLIGYASTRWAAIFKGLRFYIDDEKGGMVTDDGKPTEWYPHHLTEDLHTDEDYAVVARVYDPETRSVVVLVSGGTQYGTEAAAALVTDPKLLAEALKDKPKDWFKGNIQIVLHVKVIGNSPAAPEVIATDFR